MAELELWGGTECTVVRVGDQWRDQSHLSGHHGRDEDLDLFAGLGFKAMRYPVLWERIAPDSPDNCDWSWTDARLARLRELGVRPIAGLVHHGSGPRHTSLLDPEFPAKLGRFAGQAARRYPWITDWTPVNEPLTTARFSALYGHWYPHRRDERSFWTALVNQIDGVVHAMRAIRAVVPDARLIQTDDLGRTYATAPLFHQAAFDNMRRWAGWDLLFGRVLPDHPLWARMAEHGLADRLAKLADDPCPPDVIGVNNYLTSDRWLDHRLQRYPAHTHGRNFEQAYADVEAIRVLDPAPAGLAGSLREAWERYRAPLAVTEVHLGCTREEQLRWVGEAWDTAVALRDEGLDVRGVTAWALLGSCGWNTLLTADGVYETGLYDVSAGDPRPTALAPAWRGLATGAERHPVACAPGWWRRPARLIYPTVRRPARFERSAPTLPEAPDAPPLLIVGPGPLARAVGRACAARAIAHVATGSTVTREEVAAHAPWAIVDADGAGCAGHHDIPTLHLASASRASAMAEGDLIIRADLLFGLEEKRGFVADALRRLSAGRRFAAPAEGLIEPAFTPWLVDAALDLLIDGASGVWRVGHGEPISPAAFARRLAEACGLDPSLVDAAPGVFWSNDSPPEPEAAGQFAKLAPLSDAFRWFAADRAAADRRHAA